MVGQAVKRSLGTDTRLWAHIFSLEFILHHSLHHVLT